MLVRVTGKRPDLKLKSKLQRPDYPDPARPLSGNAQWYLDRMEIPDAEIRTEVDRIIRARTFAHAQRLRAFLSYIVHETLAGRGDKLKEYSIGRQVCGRPVSFDPKLDAIVRVDANRLRSRLQTYYEDEGAGDPVRIVLPKGCYIPSFEGSSSEAPAERVLAVAVLPFVNLSPAKDDSYFSDSLTEELIHALTRVPRLRVIARSSAFQFRQSSEDGPSIGRRLGVRYVLEGSTRLRGAQLGITAQLIDVHTGWLLWSEKYEQEWSGVFAVQDEIIASITDALRVRLTCEDAKRVFRRATAATGSYPEYLKGRYYWNQRTRAALALSVECYEQALALDPECAPAYAGLADTYTVMALNDHERTSALMLKARQSARKAIELEPDWPDALVSLGTVKSIFDWDWEGGARAFERALRELPGSAAAHYLYAIMNLQPCARWTEALEHMQEAIESDPVSPVLLRDLGIIHFMKRDSAKAESCFAESERLAPSFLGTLYWRARVAIDRGNYFEAISLLGQRAANGDANTRVTATMAYAYARSGDRNRAMEIYGSLLARTPDTNLPALDAATVMLGLEKWECALSWLEKACTEREATLYQFGVDPLYDPIRSDIRSETVRLAMGLPQR